MLKLVVESAAAIKTEALLIPICSDLDIHCAENKLSLFDEALKLKEFSGKKNEVITFYGNSGIAAERVIFFGIGKFEEIDRETFRAAAGKAVKRCIGSHLENAAILIPSAGKLKMDINDLVKAIGEGAFLANHLFDKYKNKKELHPLKDFSMLVNSDVMEKCASLPSDIETICAGTILAREWVSTPSNDKRPETFAKFIIEAAEKEKIKVSLLSKEDIVKLNMGGILGVSMGSDARPCMVILDYNPNNSKNTYAFVGKGITFDSGGINLKPSSSLDWMKMDMAGGAAVAASVITIAKLGTIKSRIIGVIPIVENMPSGSALRTDDIITSFSGKTIEVKNTDAEGRLILCDAIAYAEKEYKPNVIIDLATLTGACVVALGEKIAGVFSSDNKLSDAIVKSGDNVYERCWNMPLPSDYKKLLKSSIADISNVSDSRWGGAITGALFLSEFIEKARWAHIDIAGPASFKKPSPYCGAGGTGFGVRLILDLILNDSLV